MTEIPGAVIYILNKLIHSGYEAYIAGGWVRDMLLDKPSKDIDIVTTAYPDDIELLFDDVKFVGRDFGVSLIKHNDLEFEVATARKDGPYSDSRHPDYVEFCSLEEDAKRRDLTINALFYCPFSQKVLDFVGGRIDIKNKEIRFVGVEEHRIKEDPIRMLRALRFANRLDFKINAISTSRIREYSQLINKVAKERISLEMNKILEQCDSFIFNLLNHHRLLKYIIPELEECIGCEQPPEFHPEGDVWTHTLMTFDEVKKQNPTLELLWAALLHDIGKPLVKKWDDKDKRFRFNNHDKVGAEITRDILSRLKFSCDFNEKVVSLVENHMKFGYIQKLKIAKLKRFLFMPNFEDHIKLHKADCLSSHGGLDNIDFCNKKIQEFSQENDIHDLPKPIITGYDLLDLEMKPGSIFRIILDKCMDYQLENQNVNKEKMLVALKGFIDETKS